jgi:uncharacterized protein YjbJ (UPF0337 family)
MSKKDKAKNATQVTKGDVKEAAGQVSGNDRLVAEGKIDQMVGHIKQAGEKIKDAVKK